MGKTKMKEKWWQIRKRDEHCKKDKTKIKDIEDEAMEVEQRLLIKIKTLSDRNRYLTKLLTDLTGRIEDIEWLETSDIVEACSLEEYLDIPPENLRNYDSRISKNNAATHRCDWDPKEVDLIVDDLRLKDLTGVNNQGKKNTKWEILTIGDETACDC